MNFNLLARLVLFVLFLLPVAVNAQPPYETAPHFVHKPIDDGPVSADPRSTTATILLDELEKPNFDWDFSQPGCEDLYETLTGFNFNNIGYLFETHNFFAYVMIDENSGEYCWGHCLDKNHGMGGEPAALGLCYAPSTDESEAALVGDENVRAIEGLEVPYLESEYLITFQICSACEDCIQDQPNQILWWEGEKGFNQDDFPNGGEDAEMYLVYMGFVPCEGDLNCNNWPN